MTLNPVLTSAFVFLLLALGIFFWTTTRAGEPHQNRTLIVCWLLFALFASLLLFHFFPTDQASGTLFGLSVTGAVAVFLVVWSLGPKWSREAKKVDALESQIKALESEILRAPGRREPVKLPPGRMAFRLTGKKTKTVGLVTGNLSSVKGIDVWVNPENTYMQMARFFEKNISGTIRYLGAKRDNAGDILEDIVGNALAREMDRKTMVQPGAVIETTSGELLESHGVKRILHVAAVRGEPEAGFSPVENIGGCVQKVLDRTCALTDCRSILFPLMGTGTGRGNLASTAGTLILAAISWLESNDQGVEAVYFLTWTDVERDVCRNVLEKSERVRAA